MSRDLIERIIRYTTAIGGNVSDAGAAITDFDTNLAEATDNHYNGMLLMFISGACAGQSHIIDDYAGGTKNVAFAASDQWTEAPANGDAFIIIPDSGAYLKKIFDSIGVVAADLAVPGIDAITNALERDVIGNKEDTASDDPDVNNLSIVRMEKALLRGWKCVIPNIDVSLAAIDNVLTTSPAAGAPDVENTILDLAITTGTMYKLEDLVLKVSSYGTGTQITIQCWELLNGNVRGSYVNTTSVIVPTDFPITVYLSLIDLFGKPTVVGDGIAITAITDAGNAGALTCTYSYSTARVS